MGSNLKPIPTPNATVPIIIAAAGCAGNKPADQSMQTPVKAAISLKQQRDGPHTTHDELTSGECVVNVAQLDTIARIAQTCTFLFSAHADRYGPSALTAWP